MEYQPSKVAPLETVQTIFGAEQTGGDPRHFTVHLPEKVTEQVATQFNSVFVPMVK